MALPTTYDADTLAAFMAASLGDVATALGWDATTETWQVAINRTLRRLGLADVADATDMDALEAVALWQAWDLAVTSLAARYDIAIDGQSLSRSQIYEHAVRQRTTAQYAAMAHTDVYGMVATPVVYTNDPYRAIDEGES